MPMPSAFIPSGKCQGHAVMFCKWTAKTTNRLSFQRRPEEGTNKAGSTMESVHLLHGAFGASGDKALVGSLLVCVARPERIDVVLLTKVACTSMLGTANGGKSTRKGSENARWLTTETLSPSDLW